MAYWACKPCTSYAMGINHRVKQMEEKMTAMQHSMDSNTAAVKEVERKVEKLDSKLQEKEEDLEKIVKKTEFNIYDEMRERETRRLNVVFHGVGEKESEEGDTGKDRAVCGFKDIWWYITHYSLGMITRTWSTLYLQRQFLIYAILHCGHSGKV